MTASLLIAGVGAAVCIGAWCWHRAQYRAISARRHGARTDLVAIYPAVTVVRPVRGRDPGAERNFAAALECDYPGPVETLFVFDDLDDPGFAVAREALRAHSASQPNRRGAALVAGPPPAGMTGKLHAMSVGARHARGTLIAFGDSDTRPDQRVLRETVQALLSDPRAGAAFAPVKVHERPRAAGDAIYSLMQNAMYAPLLEWTARRRGELPFIMGQLMVFRREALDAIGGVESAAGHLVDDMYLGARVVAAGWKNVLGEHPLDLETAPMTLREFFPIFRRWMRFSRNGLPVSFNWPQWALSVTFWIALLLAVGALATRHVGAALLPVVGLAEIGASLLALQRRYGGVAMPWRLAWTAWAFFLVAPTVLLANAFTHRVDWRGRAYQLRQGDGLAPRSRQRPSRRLGRGR